VSERMSMKGVVMTVSESLGQKQDGASNLARCAILMDLPADHRSIDRPAASAS
jgi:hypothetical protein